MTCPLTSDLNGQPQATQQARTIIEPRSFEFWEKIGISTVLVLLGGVFSGLTIGLMALDKNHLRVFAVSSEDPKQQRNAQKGIGSMFPDRPPEIILVLSLIQKDRYWVLIVLLMSNVIINETLPIFLENRGWYHSGRNLNSGDRIIPQAVSVRYGLPIGATCAPLVLVLMYLFSPVAYPIARLLDCVLGKHHTHTYRKAELRSFLQLHLTGEEPFPDERSILNGVLALNTKNAETIMTPMKDVLTLAADAILDQNLVGRILFSGFSRFPVHEKGNPDSFIGLLLINKLLKYNPALALPVSHFPLSILPEARPSINCFQALNYLHRSHVHLLLISRTPGIAACAMGVITLEDIIEEILSEGIIGETDRYEVSGRKRQTKRIATAVVLPGIVECSRGVSSIPRPAAVRTPLIDVVSVKSQRKGFYGRVGARDRDAE
ncbi:hypothetical protein B0H11DRAFT_1922612 [Mycena galericulata]|nr:hypothetical protein B0H11DRAFT_1922612 [Mycena galericulata]